jgi:MSHA biogenesis protein MshL
MNIPRSMGVALLALVAAACASSPPVTAPQTQVRLEPPRPSADASAPLPALPVLSSGGTISEGTSGPRVQDLTAVNQEFGTVVRALAKQFGLQYQIDPAVRGLVNTTIRNATLPEALAMILPQGATYQIANGVLRIAPARMETRIFSLDYVALSRVGTASTVIQRRLGTSGVGNSGSGNQGAGGQAGFGGASGGIGGGADVISAVSVADVWEEIRVAVEALVFDEASSTSTSGNQSVPGMQGSSGMGGGRPYSRNSPDGKRLIVNPIAGTITVSAFGPHLEQIETFIRTFEASIQRQVLIEAKIVEVNLDRESEFGINWDVVATNAAGSFSPGGAGQNNISLRLRAGNTQINAVLTALQSQGNVQVLSSPRVSALNNQRAVFNVTRGEIVFSLTQQPITNPNGTTSFSTTVNPTQVNVGIVLDVLPQIGADNTVTMNIRPVVTSVARTASFTVDGNTLQAPVIDTRESDTMARLRGGETIVIGGLMQNRRERVRSGVPVLMHIPLLGRLFSRTRDVESKAELVIFLTPTIIAGQPPAAR